MLRMPEKPVSDRDSRSGLKAKEVGTATSLCAALTALTISMVITGLMLQKERNKAYVLDLNDSHNNNVSSDLF